MKNRHQFLTLAAIGVFVVMSTSGCSDTPNQIILPADSKVIALGDSLTYGYGASPETAYPSVLAEMTRWSIINAGVNGDTSAAVLARIDRRYHGTKS